jgi:hypothetical protein
VKRAFAIGPAPAHAFAARLAFFRVTGGFGTLAVSIRICFRRQKQNDRRNAGEFGLTPSKQVGHKSTPSFDRLISKRFFCVPTKA